MFTKILFVLSILTLFLLPVKAQNSLTVNINGLSSNEGDVKLALFNSKESYNNGTPYRTAEVSIKNLKAIVSFTDLQSGNYAIKLFHDENKNGELDTGMFGIPKEGYAFSNNATGSFGPASFEDARFEITDKTLIQNLKIN